MLLKVVERSAVPGTQDILGRCEIELDNAGDVVGYGRTDRYRPNEMRSNEDI